AADRAHYERSLIDFHKILAKYAPAGFRSSLLFRTENCPWIAAGGPAYEDWYVLDNSAALDAISDAAISGPRKASHDQIASLAASGAAGLYRLKSGDQEAMRLARHATWFSKPALTYDAFFNQLRPITNASGAAFWLRQMALSAAPEFCLRTPEKPQLPPDVTALHCPIQVVYPS
ncbi:MAG TPA: hypothetical protein VGQ99_04735, partial [Tepidisphaeraceae bacterium]|nr:hypothetical protein [Tepidisphaeraceae bacterium]